MRHFSGLFIILSLCVFMVGGFVYSQNFENSDVNSEFLKNYGVIPLLVDVHNEIGMGHGNDKTIEAYTSLLKSIKIYADADVMGYLEKTIYPQKDLDKFLNGTKSLLNTVDVYLIYLGNKKKEFEQKKDACDSTKVSVDKGFSFALKDLDSVNIEKYLLSSMESERCSVDNRIKYNAYDKMESQVQYYYNILSKKYDYFYSNKYDIIQSLN